MILWEKSDFSPDWTELLSILADLAKLTEKCSKNSGLLPKNLQLRVNKVLCNRAQAAGLSWGLNYCQNEAEIGIDHFRRAVRKMDFCLWENKGQISCAVTAQLISTFVFATRIAQFLCFLNPKFLAYSHLCLCSSVCVRPGRKP